MAVPDIIRVKFMGKSHPPGASASPWLRRFPDGIPQWGRCRFDFDHASREYDWLVVYDDLPSGWDETLCCPPENTLLLTVEPSSIKAYGRAYVAQFGHVLTSQEPWALKHPGAIRQQPGLLWFYGMQSPHGTYDALVAAARNPPLKSALISTVCSSKRMGHTLHAARYDFTQTLKSKLPELQIYGHGVRPVHDKAEAIDPFRYHVAIENHVGPHHWTEKLADPFLGHSLPFYFGAPDAAEDFPPESFIPINIFDVEHAEKTIRAAISNDEYSKRLPAIQEARRLVLEKHGTFPLLARLIESRSTTSVGGSRSAQARHHLRARHAIRRRHPLSATLDLYDKVHLRLRTALRRQSSPGG